MHFKWWSCFKYSSITDKLGIIGERLSVSKLFPFILLASGFLFFPFSHWKFSWILNSGHKPFLCILTTTCCLTLDSISLNLPPCVQPCFCALTTDLRKLDPLTLSLISVFTASPDHPFLPTSWVSKSEEVLLCEPFVARLYQTKDSDS